MIKYLIFIIFGILLFVVQNYEPFNIGSPVEFSININIQDINNRIRNMNIDRIRLEQVFMDLTGAPITLGELETNGIITIVPQAMGETTFADATWHLETHHITFNPPPELTFINFEEYDNQLQASDGRIDATLKRYITMKLISPKLIPINKTPNENTYIKPLQYWLGVQKSVPTGTHFSTPLSAGWWGSHLFGRIPRTQVSYNDFLSEQEASFCSATNKSQSKTLLKKLLTFSDVAYYLCIFITVGILESDINTLSGNQFASLLHVFISQVKDINDMTNKKACDDKLRRFFGHGDTLFDRVLFGDNGISGAKSFEYPPERLSTGTWEHGVIRTEPFETTKFEIIDGKFDLPKLSNPRMPFEPQINALMKIFRIIEINNFKYIIDRIEKAISDLEQVDSSDETTPPINLSATMPLFSNMNQLLNALINHVITNNTNMEFRIALSEIIGLDVLNEIRTEIIGNNNMGFGSYSILFDEAYSGTQFRILANNKTKLRTLLKLFRPLHTMQLYAHANLPTIDLEIGITPDTTPDATDTTPDSRGLSTTEYILEYAGGGGGWVTTLAPREPVGHFNTWEEANNYLAVNQFTEGVEFNIIEIHTDQLSDQQDQFDEWLEANEATFDAGMDLNDAAVEAEINRRLARLQNEIRGPVTMVLYMDDVTNTYNIVDPLELEDRMDNIWQGNLDSEQIKMILDFIDKYPGENPLDYLMTIINTQQDDDDFNEIKAECQASEFNQMQLPENNLDANVLRNSFEIIKDDIESSKLDQLVIKSNAIYQILKPLLNKGSITDAEATSALSDLRALNTEMDQNGARVGYSGLRDFYGILQTDIDKIDIDELRFSIPSFGEVFPSNADIILPHVTFGGEQQTAPPTAPPPAPPPTGEVYPCDNKGDIPGCDMLDRLSSCRAATFTEPNPNISYPEIEAAGLYDSMCEKTGSLFDTNRYEYLCNSYGGYIDRCTGVSISDSTQRHAKYKTLIDPHEIYIQDTLPELYLEGWHKIWDIDTGLFYWWNDLTGISQWARPYSLRHK